MPGVCRIHLFMPKRRDNCRGQSALLQVSTRLSPPDAAASPYSRVFCDDSEFVDPTAWEQGPDLFRLAVTHTCLLAHAKAQTVDRPVYGSCRSVLPGRAGVSDTFFRY